MSREPPSASQPSRSHRRRNARATANAPATSRSCTRASTTSATSNVSIPRDKLTVITGVSGSGKSTVAFDILFAEGQRRYLESLNAYARQFVQPAGRADVDAVYGIPPTVAIEQRTSRGGRKSTVATLTEIYHFMRLLFVKLGVQHCPDCGVADRRAERRLDSREAHDPVPRQADLAARAARDRPQGVLHRARRLGVEPRLRDAARRRRGDADGALAAARPFQGAQHRAAGRGDRRESGRRGRSCRRARAGAEARPQHGEGSRNQARGRRRDDRGGEAARRHRANVGGHEAVAPERGRGDQQARQEPRSPRRHAGAEQCRRRGALLDRARVLELRPQLRAARPAALLLQLALRLVHELLRHGRAARRLRRRADAAKRHGGRRPTPIPQLATRARASGCARRRSR